MCNTPTLGEVNKYYIVIGLLNLRTLHYVIKPFTLMLSSVYEKSFEQHNNNFNFDTSLSKHPWNI